jgi:acyl carrier protein
MPVDPTTLRTIVVGAIADAAEVEPGEIPDHRSIFDLGLDSLHFVAIVIDIEDRLGEDIPPELLDRFLNVGDAVTVRDVVAVFSNWVPVGAGIASPRDEVIVIARG